MSSSKNTGNIDPFAVFQDKDVLVVTREVMKNGRRRKYRGILKIYGDFLAIETDNDSLLLSRDNVLRVERFIENLHKERGEENVERTTGQSK